MLIAILYYWINKLIGITTKLLFKTDITQEIREEFIKDFIKYLTKK